MSELIDNLIETMGGGIKAYMPVEDDGVSTEEDLGGGSKRKNGYGWAAGSFVPPCAATICSRAARRALARGLPGPGGPSKSPGLSRIPSGCRKTPSPQHSM